MRVIYVSIVFNGKHILHLKKRGMEIMAHSLNKVWIHAVWTTKNRVPLIDETVQDVIFKKINDEIRGQVLFTSIKINF